MTINLKLQKVQELLLEIQSELNGISNVQNPKKVDEYKGYHKKTLDFLDELRKHYGNRMINKKDTFVQDLEFKYRLKDLAALLRRLEAEGKAIVEKNESNRITSFILG